MKYSKHTTEALNSIEAKWKGLEDTDRTQIGDAIELAIKDALAEAFDGLSPADALATIKKLLA